MSADKNGAPSPTSLGLADLAKSGLSAEDAKKLRLQFLAPEQTAKLDASFKKAPATKFTYFGLSGKANGFYRLRYLELRGLDRLAKKPMRYTQLPGTTPSVYLPPLGVDWAKVAKDPGRKLVITEGEKKAAAATKAGFPTVGLGGVWSFRSKRAGVGLLPLLKDEFAWEGREVYLVFDSDYRTNPQVMHALCALATELGALGAKPRIATVPDPGGGAKAGVDDFLVAQGKMALAKLLDAAEPFSHVEELWRMNSEVLYVRDPGLVIVLADGRKLAPNAFVAHAYANRYYHERTVTPKGEERLVKRPLAPAWVGWERRAEVSAITYRPGEPRVTAAGEYNYWPGWGCEPARGDVSPWRELLDYLFADEDPQARRWFEQWCAYPLQHPGAKLYSTVVLWGPTHGVGKSLVGLTLGKIYGRNFSEINDQDLANPFNEWAENKQFVLADDVTGAEHKKALMDRLKAMITRSRLRVNAKYLPTYEVPDCINYFFTSNHPDAFQLEDTDRRYFVHEVPQAVRPREFYRGYDAWLHGDGPSRLFAHLRALDLSGFDPKGPALATRSKSAMARDAKSDLGSWVAALKESPDEVLRLGSVALSADLYSTGQLLDLYDPERRRGVTANGLGRELKRAGFRQVNGGAVVMTSARGPQRLYAVRNAERWLRAKPGPLREHYDGAAAPAQEQKF